MIDYFESSLQHFCIQYFARQKITHQLFLFCLHYITTFTAVSRQIFIFLLIQGVPPSQQAVYGGQVPWAMLLRPFKA